MRPTMIIHGGAGSGKFGEDDRRFDELKVAIEEGMAALKKGSSIDGVEAAVSRMEQSGAFNAGRGACLTSDGRVQLDAAIMEGKSHRSAGVGAETSTYRAVSLARWVMENTKHVLLVGGYTDDVARAAGLPVEDLKPSDSTAAKYAHLISNLDSGDSELLQAPERLQEGNTVGAVAIDSEGVPAAAVSTGGLWLKLPGRVGDSAIIGAGIFADLGTGAACATGTGEEIIRNVLSWQACNRMRRETALAAARRTIAVIGRRSGPRTAGIVTVDRKGRLGFAYNTEAMGRAWYDSHKGRAVVQV